MLVKHAEAFLLLVLAPHGSCPFAELVGFVAPGKAASPRPWPSGFRWLDPGDGGGPSKTGRSRS